VEFFVRLYPLSVKVNTRYRASVIAAHNPVRVKGRYQYEGVETAEKLGFIGPRAQEVVYPVENEA
jgi:hypothetical protein